jgi:uncharacterized protein YbaR (Trm112 family)
METRLLDLLVCPLCKGRLYPNASHTELICRGDRLAFPVRDGVPVMLDSQARNLNADDEADTNAHLASDGELPPPDNISL